MTETQKPQTSDWYAAEGIDRMVREIDVAIHGENAAPQARLCDLLKPILDMAQFVKDVAQSDVATADANRCQVEVLYGRIIKKNDRQEISQTIGVLKAILQMAREVRGGVVLSSPSFSTEENQ